MEIRNNSNLNFQAKRVLTAKRVLKTGEKEITDVFKLDRAQDIPFAKKCCEAIANRKNPAPRFVKFQNFLKSFISDNCIHGDDFYVSIKDGERISGFQKSFSGYNECAIFENSCAIDDNYAKDILFYAFLNKMKKPQKVVGANMPIYGLDLGIKNASKHRIRIEANELPTLKKEIRRHNPDIAMKSEPGLNKCNLEEFLGIKDIETDVPY